MRKKTKREDIQRGGQTDRDRQEGRQTDKKQSVKPLSYQMERELGMKIAIETDKRNLICHISSLVLYSMRETR